jgi:RNA-directed DNA polymerase
MVNGPEDVVLEWGAIDWRYHEDNVRRLRQRIFAATRQGDLATVRNLQKLMLRSWSNTLISVAQATQRNAGRKTAGIDGQVALTSSLLSLDAEELEGEVDALDLTEPILLLGSGAAGNQIVLDLIEAEQHFRIYV